MPLEIRFNTNYTFDENLREAPDEPAEMERAVNYLTTLLIGADSASQASGDPRPAR